MSYQVLARKWRPQSFAEVVGQQHVLTVLANALSLGRVHHAYLFSGTRGVGKTSIARLLAKGLNCEQGITATPCGHCDNCKDIEHGRFIDLLEIDAASRTKVEDTREILDNIQYLPTKGRFKVYLIDEVHMLSRSSFNALLKTLEEPPEHVKFLLATTDPQKLPVTILSRCLHLHLSVLDSELIKQQLLKILQVEHIATDDKAVQLIANAANGSMRDALSLTDQAIALGNGQIDGQSVSIMLGTLDRAVPLQLIEALFQGEGNQLMQHIDEAAKQGIDWDNLLAETLALLHQISLLQIVPGAVGDYRDYEQRIHHLAHYVSPNDIQLFYQILLMGRKELTFAPDKKIGVEMSFLRALAFIPKALVSSSTTAQQPESAITPTHQAINRSVAAQTVVQPKPQSKAIAPTSARMTEPDTLMQPSQATAADSDDNVPDATRRILAARQQVIEGGKNPKKSEQVALNQPDSSFTNKQNSTQSLNLDHVSAPKSDHCEAAKAEIDEIVESAMTAENYQWQFSEHFTSNNEAALAAKTVKQAFAHEQSAELTEKLITQAIEIDPWSAEIDQLNLPPLIKQIAMNAFIEQIDSTHLTLHLRSALAHLVGNENNLNRLKQLLSAYRGNPCQITVVIDDDLSHLTPLEVREQIYQLKLAEAKQLVRQDNKIAMICQIFEARIDESSIRPV